MLLRVRPVVEAPEVLAVPRPSRHSLSHATPVHVAHIVDGVSASGVAAGVDPVRVGAPLLLARGPHGFRPLDWRSTSARSAGVISAHVRTLPGLT